MNPMHEQAIADTKLNTILTSGIRMARIASRTNRPIVPE